MKDIHECLRLTRQIDILDLDWRASVRTMPKGGLSFLREPFIAGACRDLALPAEIAEAAARAGAFIGEDACRRALIWHCHRLIFDTDVLVGRPTVTSGGSGHGQYVWPSVQSMAKTFGEHAGMFYLLVFLSGVERLREIYRKRSIPPAVRRRTLSDIGMMMLERLREHRSACGAWGMPPSVPWLSMVLRGEYYRLGRLSFELPRPWHPLFHVFRRRREGTLLALSAADVTYLADGHLYGNLRFGGSPDTWVSRFRITKESYTGFPLHPQGHALRRELALPRSEWRHVLGPAGPAAALVIHYPGGEPLDFDACGKALRAALRFFPRHFPDRPFAAITGCTWFMNAQLQELLPATSNMVRFQKEVYLYPVLADDLILLNHALEHVPDALRTGPRRGSVGLRLLRHALDGNLLRAKRDTSLQRAILEHLAAGGELRAKAGGCFMFPEDIDWGGQVYLNSTVPLLKRLLA